MEEDDGHLDPDHPHYYQLHPHNLQRQQQQVSTDKKQGGVGDHMYQTRPPKRGEEEKGEEEEKKPIAMIVVKPNSSESRTRGWSGDLVSFEGVENKRILMK